MDVDAVKLGIDKWGRLVKKKKTKKILNYLNQGFCFQVTRADLKTWEPQRPTSIHAYACILDKTLKFALVDDVSDEQRDYSKLVVKDYTCGLPPCNDTSGHNPLSEEDPHLGVALKRSFEWKMYCQGWMEQLEMEDRPIFQAFGIPFSDYEHVLKYSTSAVNFFGLRSPLGNATQAAENEQEIEIIVGDEPGTFIMPTALSDVTRPVPPFSEPYPEPTFGLLP